MKQHDRRFIKITMKTNALLFYLLFLWYISTLGTVSGKDPCQSYTLLQRIDQRLPSKQAATQRELICDRYLEKNWYKAESAKMTETVPKLRGCSTTFPVYLSGPHPTDGNIKDMKACKVGLWGLCTSSIPIQVKNCGEFYVYYLQSTRTCSSAYCFEYIEEEEAPDEIPINVVASYSDIQWKDKEKKDHNDNIYFSFPYLIYSCTFDIIPNKDYCYKISWLIGNKVVHEQGTKENITKGESRINDLYFPEDDYHLGITLYCSVGASYCGKSRVGKRVTSKGFFIGLQLQTKEPIIMEEAGRKTISFKSTVPFACTDHMGIQNTCSAYIQISKNLNKGCNDDIQGSKFNCNEEITGYTVTEYDSFYKNKKWDNELYSMELVHVKSDFIDEQTLRTEQYLAVLEVDGGDNDLQLWKGARDIAKIRVYVEMKEKQKIWKDSVCGATGDPHIRSFDNENFDDHGDGTRYLYVNRNFSQQVQVRNFACNPGNLRIRCICGVAVSAGRDVFFISVCNRNKLIDYVNCQDHFLLVQKIDEHNYEVRMPQGTKVVIKLHSSMINVWIYPSITDVEETEGLCGHLDRRRDEKDFIFFGKKFRANKKDILNKGISVPVDKDLFGMIERDDFSSLQPPNTKVALCTCKTTSGTTKELTCEQSIIECDMSIQMRKLIMPCFVRSYKKRRRRYILKDNTLREKRQSQTNSPIFVMTEEEALVKCNELLMSSKMYNVCLDVVKGLGKSFAEDCKLDLMYTGDEDFASMALEGALGSCKYAVVRNTALQRNQPLLTREIVLQICPNNCSGNGLCNNGSCSCEPSFGGADCSYSLVEPPKVLSVHGGGLCDRSQENCQAVVFYGDNFLQYGNTTCNISVWQFWSNGTLSDAINHTITSGEQYSIFQASCDLDYSSRAFATLAKVSISNDGYMFTSEYEVINYDSTCQTYDATARQVKLQIGYCFIDGVCYSHMERNPRKVCQFCKTDKNIDSWSQDTSYCFIGDNCYKDLEPNPEDNCEACLISKNILSWSISSTTCIINGTCHLNGASNPENKCEVCDIESKGRYQWAKSHSSCVIDGECYTDGETSTENQCLTCHSERNSRNWTLESSYCFIAENCVRNGRSNLENPCYMCNVEKNKYEWSEKNQYCYKEDRCYLPGDVVSGEPCYVCGENKGKKDWLLNPNICMIEGHCYSKGHTNPQNVCYECNPSGNQTSWSQSEMHCIIEGECYSDGDNNTEKDCLNCNTTLTNSDWSLRSEEHCYIDGECYKDDQDTDRNICQKCNVFYDPFGWFTKAGYCYINGSCFVDGEKDANSSCRSCVSSQIQNEWTLEEDFCFINDTCYRNGTIHESLACLACDVSYNLTLEWSVVSGFCFVNEECYENGDPHPSNQDLICKAQRGLQKAWSNRKEDDHDQKSLDVAIVIYVAVPIVVILIVIGIALYIMYRRKTKSGSFSVQKRHKGPDTTKNPMYEAGEETNVGTQLLQPEHETADQKALPVTQSSSIT